MSTVKVANADRMIIAVVPGSKGIDATFADGSQGTVPFKDIPEVGDHSNLKSVELPNPYEVILTTPQNEQVELPWDFVRHYCDHTYQPRMEMIASLGRQTLGARVRSLREAAGLTQEALARAAGIGRVTMVRLENGRNAPKLGTLESIAKALEQPIEDLLTGHDDSEPNVGPQSSKEDPLNINAGENTTEGYGDRNPGPRPGTTRPRT